MAKRVAKPRTIVRKNTRTEVHEDKREESPAKAIQEGIDDLLDEIDGVLEENAEEFLKNYQQKGGE